MRQYVLRQYVAACGLRLEACGLLSCVILPQLAAWSLRLFVAPLRGILSCGNLPQFPFLVNFFSELAQLAIMGGMLPGMTHINVFLSFFY